MERADRLYLQRIWTGADVSGIITVAVVWQQTTQARGLLHGKDKSGGVLQFWQPAFAEAAAAAGKAMGQQEAAFYSGSSYLNIKHRERQDMIRLVYASSATREMSEDDLLFLLEQSRRRNEKQGVTGMLLYVGNNFIQVLEGADEDVMEIYHDIVNDDRNTGNVLMLKEEMAERAFPEWSMGFKHLSERDKGEVKGYTEFLDRKMTPQQIAALSNKTLGLLYFFKEIHV